MAISLNIELISSCENHHFHDGFLFRKTNKTILKTNKMETNNNNISKPIKKNNKFEKLGFSMLYLSVIAYIILAFFALTSCSSDDDSNPENNTVAIPDANFEQALIDLEIDTNGLNGNILKTDAEAVPSLNITNKNINDLQGIEAFVGLSVLRCGYNNLISLDVSSNTELQILSANNNQLSEINLQNNPELYYVNTSNNQLTSLDVSNMRALGSLFCFSNAIEMLDVSNNEDLSLLSCSFNALTSLDVSNNNALTSLSCDSNALTSLNVKNGNNANFNNFNATSNFNLFCIQVDDVAYSNTNWSSGIDGFSVFAEDCN